MAKIYTDITQLVGRTPLFEAKNFAKKHGLQARLLLKLECFNPTGSAKDRAALEMILDAEEKGLLKKDGLIIEPTSGNTGLGLAAVAASRGYKAIIVMPDTMSRERQLLMKAYGAELVLTEGAKGMKGAIEMAEKLQKENYGSFIPGQFENPANPAAHYKTTGPEIWEDSEQSVDIFVAGVGTGGTVSGVGRYLKEQNRNIKVVAAEPAGSPLLTEGRAGSHNLQGMGANFVPDNLDRSVLDEIVTVTEEEAYACTRDLGKLEGFAVGISSGAALAAAVKQAQKEENKGKTIVALLPDTGERYLSTPLFGE